MKDLDFDELDQAVSSVLGAKEEPEAKTSVAIPDTAAKSDVEAPKPLETEAKTEDKPVPAAPAASPAVRRRGQFLDMVHPSADMTSRLPVSAPAARKQITPISADAASLKPDPVAKPAEVAKIEDEIEQPTTAAPETAPEPQKEPVPAAELSVAAESTAPVDEVKWPDPLDLDAAIESAKDAEPADEPAAEKTPVESAGTPFVPDVKVDKRPLGSPVAQPAEPVVAEAPVPVPTDATASAPVPTEEPKIPEATPPELQPDVVSVEAAANREFAPDGKDTETDSDANKGMAQSIPQQYQTPAEKSDDAAHPVFDTQEYHQPLLPAHSKKKRGWLVIVVILGLLVVGAALGYFAFMAGL